MLLDRKPGQISGGQQQRVAVARAMACTPSLYLFDEPLSNLDARLRLEARTFLKQLQRELGVTTILVTHDQSQA
jgi:multiple sugar transport system ATP-binding protein